MLRASDAARDAAAERLKDAYVRGNLDLDEFRGRVESALEAPTVEELARLTGDVRGDTGILPAIAPVQMTAATEQRRSRRMRVRVAALALAALGGASAMAVVNHERNDVPSHCLVMGQEGFYRVC